MGLGVCIEKQWAKGSMQHLFPSSKDSLVFFCASVDGTGPRPKSLWLAAKLKPFGLASVPRAPWLPSRTPSLRPRSTVGLVAFWVRNQRASGFSAWSFEPQGLSRGAQIGCVSIASVASRGMIIGNAVRGSLLPATVLLGAPVWRPSWLATISPSMSRALATWLLLDGIFHRGMADSGRWRPCEGRPSATVRRKSDEGRMQA